MSLKPEQLPGSRSLSQLELYLKYLLFDEMLTKEEKDRYPQIIAEHLYFQKVRENLIGWEKLLEALHFNHSFAAGLYCLYLLKRKFFPKQVWPLQRGFARNFEKSDEYRELFGETDINALLELYLPTVHICELFSTNFNNKNHFPCDPLFGGNYPHWLRSTLIQNPQMDGIKKLVNRTLT